MTEWCQGDPDKGLSDAMQFRIAGGPDQQGEQGLLARFGDDRSSPGRQRSRNGNSENTIPSSKLDMSKHRERS